MKAFPNAKVVLTVRNPETWQASIKNTICKMRDIHNDFACSLFNKITGTWHLMNTMIRISDYPLEATGKGIL